MNIEALKENIPKQHRKKMIALAMYYTRYWSIHPESVVLAMLSNRVDWHHKVHNGLTSEGEMDSRITRFLTGNSTEVPRRFRWSDSYFENLQP
jgi:hypothetical protein